MADYTHYPRTLPRTIDEFNDCSGCRNPLVAEMQPILRRYHETADRVDAVCDRYREVHRDALRRDIVVWTPAARLLHKQANRLMLECQGYRELVLFALEASPEAYLLNVALSETFLPSPEHSEQE